MKYICTLLLSIISFSGFSQSIIKDTLFVNDSIKIIVGQKLQLGEGSNMTTRDFNFILCSNLISSPLSGQYSGNEVTVKDIKKRAGIFYVNFNVNGLPYHCSIVPALRTKEIILSK